MELTIIILNYNTSELLKNCLNSIFEFEWNKKFEIWVVDNNSSDKSVEMVKKHFPKVKLMETGENLGFAGGNNIALRRVKSKYAMLLNSDTIVLDGSLDALVEFMNEGHFGIGTCKLLNKDKSFQPNAGDLPFGMALFSWISGIDDIPFVGELLPSFHIKSEKIIKTNKNIGWVSGTAMIIKNEVIEKIGLLDNSLFMYAEDTDYCIRAKKAGFKIGWTDTAQIIHLGGGSLVEPSYRQWLGEFKGLIYLYKKYLGNLASFILRLSFYLFIIVRMIVFLIIGKGEISKIYGKVFMAL